MDQKQFELIETKVQQAESYFSQGEFQKALEIYTNLLSCRLQENLRDATDLIASDLVIIERLADLSVLFGNFMAADDLLNAMVKLLAQAGNRYGADYALVKRIHLKLMFGHLKEAYNLLESMLVSTGDIHKIDFSQKGLAHWESSLHWPGKGDDALSVLFSRLYLVMGALLSALGQYKNAIAAFKRGLYHCGQSAPDLAQQALVPLHLLLAGAYLEKGDPHKTYTELEKLTTKINQTTHPGNYVHFLDLFGKLNLLRGDLGKALDQFKEILSFCQQRGFHKATSQAALNLAHVLIYLNQTAAAKQNLVKVMEYAKEMGDQVAGIRAACMFSLAYARSHSMTEGVAIASSVSEMWDITTSSIPATMDVEIRDPRDLPQSENYLAFFEDRALGFYWRLGYRDINESANYLSEIINTFEHTDSDLIHIRLRIMTGILAYYQNDLAKAEKVLNQVCSTIIKLELKPDLWQVQRVLRWCAVRLNLPPTEQQARMEQSNSLLTDIAKTLSGSDRAIFLLNKWTADEEYIASKINQLKLMKAQLTEKHWILRPFLRWRMLKYLDALLTHIDAYKNVIAKRRLSGKKVEMADESNSSLWRRLLRPSRKQISLSFLILPDRVLITRIGWLSLDFWISYITRIQVRELVQQWHSILHEIGRRRDVTPIESHKLVNESENYRKQITKSLAEILQFHEILKKVPKRIRSIHIIPDDILHGFSFGAIFYKGKYLAERFALSVGFKHDNPKTAPTLPTVLKTLIVGVSKGAGSAPPLPGVEKELDAIESWFISQKAKVYRLMNYTASKMNVLKHISQFNLIHIACHGTFKPDKPDQSGLILSPAPGQVEILSILDLSRLNLTGLKHITLSSCWSADNFILPGRWIISLPETLWRSGAQSILGSLWPVDDRFSIAFMKKFYEYLMHLPRDKALQKTQQDCLNHQIPVNRDIDPANPVYWAGFNLYGASNWLMI